MKLFDLIVLEWKLLVRARLIASLLAITIAALAVAAWSTAATDRRQREAQLEASARARADWLAQGPANPHGMAHYGDYVFRPSGALARFDGGVQALLGQVLRVEGHKQGSPLHRPAAASGSIGRFGRFDPAFVLQIMIPVVLILFGAAASAADRRSGRLRLAIVQGLRARELLVARILALSSIGLAALLVVGLASWVGDPSGLAEIEGGRLALMLGAHALFLAVVAAATVYVAFATREARQALLLLLFLWVAGTAILPRVTSTLVSELAPLPTRDAFESAMREERAGEMSGHNPTDRRVEALKQEVLTEHGVESVEELPLNFDGIAMQVDEEVGNEVWDKHYGALRRTLERQRSRARIASIVNPFQAIDAISMSVAGTDLAHDLDFQEQVESHRRIFIKALNDEHAYGGSKSGDWGWEAEAAFYESLAAFEYRQPPLAMAIGTRAIELVALIGWLLLLLTLVANSARRLEAGELT